MTHLDKYYHRVDLGDKQCLYDTLTGEITFIRANSEVISVPERTVAEVDAFLTPIKTDMANVVKRTQLYLILTQKCNFSCAYCRQSQNLCGTDDMTVETAIKAIQQMDEEAEGLESVVFYGGEPLVNFPVLKAAVDYIRKNKGEKVSISVITNGTLITEEIAQYLLDNSVFCVLSLDGHLPEHNVHRVSNGKKPGHEQIMEALEKLTSQGIKVGISCTVGPHNINHLGEFAEWASKKTNVGNIYFALPHFESTGVLCTGISNEMWRDSFVDTFNRAGYFVENLARIMNGLLNGSFKSNTCPSCGGRIVVRPDGMFGVCTGSLVEKNEFYRTTLAEQARLGQQWAEASSPIFDERCHDCIAFRVCGGGCPYDTYCYTKSIHEKEERRCIITQNIVLSSLKWIAEQLEFTDEVHTLDGEEREKLKSKFRFEWFTPLKASSTFGTKEK